VERQVAILGAGPGGLAAGCQLALGGGRPVVFEKEEYVGGLCHTLQHQGFRFDIGGHRWFTKNEDVDRWVRALMGDEFLRVGRLSRIYFRGRYYSYPLSLGNVLENMGPLGLARGLASYLRAQLRRTTPETTMEEAFVRQFGRVLYETFFKTYSEKVWGRSCHELSADWVEQRTKGLSLWVTLRRALSGSGGARHVVSMVEEFSYPRRGYGRISERMAEELTRLGGEIRLGTRVVGVTLNGDTIAGLSVGGADGRSSVVPVDAVISTVPLPLLIRMLEPSVPDPVRSAAERLRFRHLVTVTVFLDRPRVSDDTWVYVHDPGIPFARFHEPKNWSPEMAPAARTSLVVEYFVDQDDAVWNRSDEDLQRLTVQHLSATLGLILPQQVLASVVFRARNAYPIYDLDYRENLATVKQHLAGISNLQIVGRGGTFRYNNSDHSIEMGMLAAQNLMGGRHDLDRVNSADEYLEEREGRPQTPARAATRWIRIPRRTGSSPLPQ
jgi:protoporphyrinogen oxidase